MDAKEAKEEVDRLLTVLRTAIRLLGLTNREIERRLGLTPSYLSRLFGGSIELKVEHVVSIASAMGLTPAEFFELAYPRRAHAPSDSFRTIRTLLHDMQPMELQPPAAGQVISEEEIERRIQESVRRVLRELAGGR
ncbi:MAG: helix-turn-helix domain-containing protein [Thermoanaerobaculia bacterium]